jgi:hypothetical protein
MSAAPQMSVVHRNFDTKEEVIVMTSTVVLDRTVDTLVVDAAPAEKPQVNPGFVNPKLADAPLANGARPHGFDRLVMRLSVTMLLWAQRRAVKGSISFEEHRRRYLVQRELQAESQNHLRITSRVF